MKLLWSQSQSIFVLICSAMLIGVSSVHGQIPPPSGDGGALPEDLGVKIERTQVTNTSLATAEAPDGQVSISHDGLLRFRAEVVKADNGLCERGLAVRIFKYDEQSTNTDGTVNYSYTDPVTVIPGMYRINGGAAHSSWAPNGSGDCIVGARGPTLNVNNGLVAFFHSTLVPFPGNRGENPYLSKVDGSPASDAGTEYMTYDLLLAQTAVNQPNSFEEDANTSTADPDLYPYTSTSALRDRIVLGRVKVVVKFSAQNGYRIPTKVLSVGEKINGVTSGTGQVAGSFFLMKTGPNEATPNTLIRGKEPTLDAKGNIFAFNVHLPNSLAPTTMSAGTGNLGMTHRVGGDWNDIANNPPVFAVPYSAAEFHAHANTPALDANGQTFGDLYRLARYKISVPLGEELFSGTQDMLGAYPWMNLHGSIMTTGVLHGVGKYLDFGTRDNAASENEVWWCANTQAYNGTPYCKGSTAGPTGMPWYSEYADGYGEKILYHNKRSGAGVYSSEMLVETPSGTAMQLATFDSPYNEYMRTQGRVTGGSYGTTDSAWSPAHRLPVSHQNNMVVRPGKSVLPFQSSTPSIPTNPQGFADQNVLAYEIDMGIGKEDFAVYAPLKPEGSRDSQDYYGLTTSPYASSRQMRPVFVRSGDHSGNAMEVSLDGTGAFYPFNDPNTYTDDFYRQEHIGRVGNGAYCTSAGTITVSETANLSKSGALSNYTDQASISMWVKPLIATGQRQLAKNKAFLLQKNSNDTLTVKVKSTDSNGNNQATLTLATLDSFETNKWYHILVNGSVTGGKVFGDVYVNGVLVASGSQNGNGITQLKKDPADSNIVFCNDGTGSSIVREMVVDELAFRTRLATGDEIADMALLPTENYPAATASRLGVLAPIIAAAGLDPDEFFIPASPRYTSVNQGMLDLGQKIFFDKNLSAGNNVSCATCHQPAKGFADSVTLRTANPAVGPIKRQPMPILNSGQGDQYQKFFWDGREATLESQSTKPIISAFEMNLPSEQEAVNRIKNNSSGYSTEVQAAFGISLSQFTLGHLQDALASYMRSLIVGDSNYDRYMNGDASALTQVQKDALGAFNAHCLACHNGAKMADDQFHNIGMFNPSDQDFDAGRFEITGASKDFGAFKSISLRDVDVRDGRLTHKGNKSLVDLLQNYNDGGTHHHGNQVSSQINGMGLSAAELQGLDSLIRDGMRSNYRDALEHEDPWGEILGL